MASRPKRNAVTNRKPTNALLDNTTRQTPAEVKRDKAEAAATAAQASELTAINNAAKKTRVASHEDRLRKQDEARQKVVTRPDLQSGVHPKSVASNPGKKSVDPVVEDFTVHPKIVLASNVGKRGIVDDLKFTDYASDTLLAPDCDDHDAETSDGIVNIPEDSVVDTESSMSDAGLGLGGFLDELESDGDHEQDADYIMSHKSDVDDSDEFDSRHAEIEHIKNKKKTQRGDFRKAVNEIRNAAPVRGTDTLPPKLKLVTCSENIDKRAKHGEVSGLLPGWKQKLEKDRAKTVAARQAQAVAHHDDDDDPLEYAGGEFDNDEPVELIKVARDMKTSGVHAKRQTTVKVEMGTAPVSLVRTTTGRGRVKKEKFTVTSLPFPRGSGGTAYSQRWRRVFKPSLIEWAATYEDPFGTNAEMDTVVEGLWAQIFPTLATAVVDGGEGRAAIIQVAGDALLNWRSAMGKEGIRIVVEVFNDEGIEQADASEIAKYYLENYRFIYAHPDDDEDKEAFRSPLVLFALAAHLKMTIGNTHLNDEGYGYPIGGLAVAVAVIERGLWLVKSGQIKLNGNTPGKSAIASGSDETNGRKRKVNEYDGYTDSVWGVVTCGWVAAAKRLNAEKWNAILTAAVAKVDFSKADEEEEEGGAGDPRALVEI
ncbi:hypothetical protein BYT27DRAFT_7305696 [Phlegmacium glaucopus]|nr:hypothetical protein BYT27DRAFT_7305696 [Phlegmacium glaucopus]